MANLPKHPLRRFEPTLHKFQIALPADLARLQLHKVNMEKVQTNKLLLVSLNTKLHSEHFSWFHHPKVGSKAIKLTG